MEVKQIPRRKKGRDKPKGLKRRNRKQVLPSLNVKPFQKIGDNSLQVPELGEPVVVTPWEQRVPLHKDREFEQVVVMKRGVLSFAPSRRPRRIKRKRAGMEELDAYNLLKLSSELEKYRQYDGEKRYVKKGIFWYIQLTDLNVQISLFDSEVQAKDWDSKYLGDI